MKVLWSDFATDTLREIYLYYKETAGKNIAKTITRSIFSSTKQLIKYPNSGQIEENLTLLGENHRYLVTGNYKIIYKPVIEGILITDIFDTRQDPQKVNVKTRKSGN